MLRLIKLVCSSILLGALVAGFIWVTGKRAINYDVVDNSETLIQKPPDVSIPTFDIIILQAGDNEQSFLTCEQQHCRPLSQIEPENPNAVTDGESWYHYVEVDNKKSTVKKQSLQRVWLTDNTEQVIVEQTELVRPRDLIISPDNQKIAYWLDNIDQPTRQLTELWLYNASTDGTQVLAEKLVRSDILTNARWNQAASHLWFVANTARKNEPEKIELLVVSLHPPAVSARFTNLDWRELSEITDHGVMDISSTGRSLAYATDKVLGKSKLTIVHEGTQSLTASVRGDIPFVQWLEDGSVLYAVQDSRGFTFWNLRSTTHKHVARQSGTLLSVRGDRQGRYIIFAAQESNRRKSPIRILALDTEHGVIAEQGTVSSTNQKTHIIQASISKESEPDTTDVTESLDDDELIFFVENNLSNIVRDTQAKHKRITVTEKPNTLYVDYYDNSNQDKRILITVNDAIHPEWSISARYQEASGEWLKTQGGGLKDPKPVRVYEWEDKPRQWILKKEYE